MQKSGLQANPQRPVSENYVTSETLRVSTGTVTLFRVPGTGIVLLSGFFRFLGTDYRFLETLLGTSFWNRFQYRVLELLPGTNC